MHSPMDVTPESIIAFLEGECRSYKGKIGMSTRVGEDLRLIGDDAEEFLERFSKEFGVDLSELPFSEYLPSEGSASLHFYAGRQMHSPNNSGLSLLRKIDSLIWGSFAGRRSFKTMTAQDLYESARAGQWCPGV